ncbi:surfactant protein B [Dictyocaulus viviparus]|uniref:Surfactant protein B n=1 Tax=Dictyocaulus viviparus TaxID=29172 RepID=A0A0D8XZM5_DICVI|nr:surfactant protein B [Dictyocaulus viviparus]
MRHKPATHCTTIVSYAVNLLQVELLKKNADKICEFLTACAICHTASPDKNTAFSERPLYHATSPDEHALLKFASDAGFIFKRRSSGKIIVDMLGTISEFELMAILEFNSDRKRMSVIVRDSKGTYKLYIKGADQMIFDRLIDVSQKEMKRTSGHLQQFAYQGYRTLCFAVKIINNDIFAKWYEKYNNTIADVKNRREKLAQLAEEIEKDLCLIGVSAIEDRLQKDVPETVARLLLAGIRVWVLTGDKLETAVNIGNSCHLLQAGAPMVVLSSTDASVVKEELSK